MGMRRGCPVSDLDGDKLVMAISTLASTPFSVRSFASGVALDFVDGRAAFVPECLFCRKLADCKLTRKNTRGHVGRITEAA